MTRLFLRLEDAVIIASREFGIDKELARNEFEQKCFITDNQYKIGYYDGIYDSIRELTKVGNKAIEKELEGYKEV